MIDIKWSKPYSCIVSNNKKTRREWQIPPELLNGFFSFWKKNKFKLLSEGYSVGKSKLNNTWFFYETQDNVALFKSPDQSDSTSKISTGSSVAEVVFQLPEYKLKNIVGLRPWQVNACQKLVAAINHWGSAADGSDMGCHSKGQLILMGDGTYKKVEDITIGDFVMGVNEVQTVTKLHRGRDIMVKIKPIKGDSFIVNINHILTLQLTTDTNHKTTNGYNYGEVYDISVKDYLKLYPTTKSAMKLISAPCLNVFPTVNQLFSPYFIGLLLGDGGLSSSAITFTNTDKILWDYIHLECLKFNWKLGNTSQTITKRIINSKNLQEWRRKVGLYKIKCKDRFIPNEYKIADKNQRLQLLAGLVDTDGFLAGNNGYQLTFKSKQLIEDCKFLAKSLGLAAYSKEIQKKCCNNGKVGTYYTLHISGDTSIIPCKILHKKSNPRLQIKNVLLRGFNVEILPENDFYGFSLSGNGRFLLSDFTITHNTGKTYSAIATARELNVPFVIVCPKAVRHSWRKVIDNHFGLSMNCKGIINYELLIRGRQDSDIASFVLKRETKRHHFTWKIPKNSIIIWDEAHKLKNYKTKTSKCCLEAFKQGYKQLFLSATLATSPLDLRTIGICLKMFKNGKTYYEWAYNHGVFKGNWGLEFNNDPKTLKRINKYLFEDRGVRNRRDEIPNFPECEIIVAAYDLDEDKVAEINKNFKEMAYELKRLDNLLKKEESQLVIRLRYRQKIELLKTELFVELAKEGREAGMSILLFVNYTETINILSELLNTTCIYSGQKTDKEKQKAIEDFQSNKEPIIIIQAKSGNAGLNLGDEHGTNPRLSIISPDDSAVVIKQCCGRGWRENSKSKSIVKIPFVSGTVEEAVVDNMNCKLTNIDTINDGDLKI